MLRLPASFLAFILLAAPALADTSVILTNTAVEYTAPTVPMVLQNVAVEYAQGYGTPLVLQNTAIEYLRLPDRPAVLTDIGVEYDHTGNRPMVLTNLVVEYEVPYGIPSDCSIVVNNGSETTPVREVVIVLSATNASYVYLPTEEQSALDSQPLIALPLPDADGRSETTIILTLSPGSGSKELFTRFVSFSGFSSDTISNSILAVFGRPDLVIPEIEFSTKTVSPGQPVNVNVRVRNDGTGEVSSATVRLALDGQPLGDLTIDTVPYGGNGARASFLWDTPVYGIHLLQATVDPSPLETDTDNNRRSRLVIVGTLDVAGFVRVQATFGNGQLTKQAYTGERVRVIGSAYYDPELTAGLPITGATVTIEDASGRIFGSGRTDGEGGFEVGIAAPREIAVYSLRVIVSDGSAGGSFGDILLTVQPLEGIEIVVYDEEVNTDPNPSGQGETVTITTLVRNLGTEGAENVRIRFLDEDIIMEDVILPSVAAGAADTVTIAYAFPEVGVRQVSVIPDPLNTIQEALELMGISDYTADPPQIVKWVKEVEAKDIEMSPLPPRVGSATTFTAKILNLGLQPTGNGAKIRYRIDGNWFIVSLTSDIPATTPPTEAAAPPVNYTFSDTGDQLIFFDIQQATGDGFPQNNDYEEYVYVWPEIPGGGGNGGGDGNGNGDGDGDGGFSVPLPPVFGDQPDLAITRIDIQNSTNLPDGERLFENDEFLAIATVRNLGDSITTSTSLSLSVQGGASGAPVTIPEMNPGAFATFPIWGRASNKDGVYSITMSINPAAYREVSTLNNSLTRKKAVFDQSGYVRTSSMFFTTSPEHIEGVAVGQPVSAFVLLENSGRERTSGMIVHYYLDGETVASIPITMLDAGETTLMEHRFTVDHAGFVTVQAVLEVDPENDLDLTDNSISRILAVGSLMNLRLLSFTAPDTGLPGETVPLAVTVQNAGDIGLRGLEVGFYDGVDEKAPRVGRVAFDLAPGQTSSGYLAWVPRSLVADHQITAIADPYHFFPEADRSDNWLSRRVAFPAVPMPPIITSPVSGAISASETITILGTAEPGAYLRIYFDGLMAGVTRADTATGNFVIAIVRGEGTYIVTATADRNGAISALSNPVTVIVCFDVRPPRTVLMIGEPHYGTAPTYITSNSLLTFNAVDDLITIGDSLGLGVSQTWYRRNGGGYLQYAGPISLTGEGEQTLSYWSEDVVGNMEAEQTAVLILDNTPPDLAFVIGEPKVESEPVVISTTTPITITAMDIGVGLGTIRYVVDGGDWQTFSGAFTLASGVHTVIARADDHLGNEVEISLPVIVDMTPPVIVVEPVPTPTNGDVTLSYTVSDNVTPPERIVVTGDASPYPAEGVYTVVLTATDLAGNYATATVGFTIDKTAPVTTLTVDSPSYGGYVTAATRLTLAATDNLTAVTRVRYRLDGGEWLDYGGEFTLAGEEAHLVEFYAADAAGNAEAVQSATLTVDGSAPVSTLTIDLASADGLVAVPESAITLTATDAGCGVERIEYRVNGGAWTTYAAPFELGSIVGLGLVTTGYRAVDRLGNAEAERTATWEVRRALDLTVGLLAAPRVLCWWNEESGDGHPAREEWGPALQAVLDSAALDYQIVESKAEFLAQLSDYNIYLLIGDEVGLEEDEDSRVTAMVAVGRGLVSFGGEDIHTPQADDQGWENIFGIKVAGVLNGTANLALYPALAAETTTLMIEGKTERITEVLSGGILGEVAVVLHGEGGHGHGGGGEADTWPAAVANTWESGKVIYLAPEYGRNLAALAGMLGNAIAMVQPATEAAVPGGVVGLRITVGNAFLPDLQTWITAIPPAGSVATAVYDGGSLSSGLVVWYPNLPTAATRDCRFLLRLPGVPGEYIVRVEGEYLKGGVYRDSAAVELAIPIE